MYTIDLMTLWVLIGMGFTVWIGCWVVVVLRRLNQTLLQAQSILRESEEIVTDVKQFEQSLKAGLLTGAIQVVQGLMSRLAGDKSE